MKPLRIHTEMRVARPASEVFEAVVDPSKMSGYFISSGTARMEAGKKVIWRWDDYNAELPIEVLQTEPGRHVSFAWSANGPRIVVDIRFESAGNDATQVKVDAGDWTPDDKGFAAFAEEQQGWVHMLVCLKAYLEHGINLRKDKPR
jgi:uncharacterized protein YndB with AHSA1/START domain